MSAPLVVLTAGGTGGHVFPAEALAAALREQQVRLALVTDRRGGAFGGALGTLETFQVRAGGVAGKGMLGRLASARELAFGLLQARTLLRRMQPRLVVGFGGYAAVPTVLAAGFARCRTLIHEQNAVLGRANRLLAARVDRIATAFPSPGRMPAASSGKVVHTGMPVRPAVAAARDHAYPVPSAEKAAFRILVLGGSQGARVFSDVVPAAVRSLLAPVRQVLRISQQCRPEDLERVRAAYADMGIAAELAPFFADMPERLAAAHLVIARAGASTVAELTAVGRPSILVPYPFAIDDHQTANARVIAEAGAACMVPQSDLSAQGLADLLHSLWREPDTLRTMAARAEALGRPDATARLVAVVVDMLGSNGAGGSNGLDEAGSRGERGRRAA